MEKFKWYQINHFSINVIDPCNSYTDKQLLWACNQTNYDRTSMHAIKRNFNSLELEMSFGYMGIHHFLPSDLCIKSA